MSLTPAQLATLKAAILADPVLAAIPNNSDGAVAIAEAMNLNAVPDYTVWKTRVTVTEIGDKINGTELAGLAQLNVARLQAVAQFSPDGVNPSLLDRRQFFDDIFSGAGGATTRGQLLALWKRLATRAEKLYATGTGTNPSPATLTFEGPITHNEVLAARALP